MGKFWEFDHFISSDPNLPTLQNQAIAIRFGGGLHFTGVAADKIGDRSRCMGGPTAVSCPLVRRFFPRVPLRICPHPGSLLV